MKIPFLDLKANYNSIKDEITPAIQNVLDNTAYVLGKPVFEFEKNFAEAHGAIYCHGVSSGTDGNHMVLWGLGIGAGDEVIIPANTFIATAWGATLCGATPVFVDCHPESYNLDPAKVEAAITEKTKAIVAVHLYGQPADMDGINYELGILNFELKEKGVYIHKDTKQKIYLVEDCAQAHLAEYKSHEIENQISRDRWKKVGSLGIASSFSFYPGKNLGAYGEGGAVMTNDKELARKFKMIRDHGAEEKYNHISFGHNYRMAGIQGAVLGVKLKHLDEWTNGRRKVAAKYNELLSDVNGIKLPKELEYAKHVYHLFVIQVQDGKRDLLQKFLGENEIASGLHYPIPLHVQPCFSHLGYKKGDFPESEVLAEQGLSLPMYPEMTNEQIEFISEKIHEFFQKKC
jgi:dTDP-4-amino-4,6-dideoxygalactose transaminase